MSPYWPEFLRLALAHMLAVMAPGPDFAIVVRQSLHHGRRAGILTAIGIGSAITLHVTYSMLGISLLVRSSAVAFDVLKFGGAAYLFWIGVKSLRAPRPGAAEAGTAPARITGRSAWAAGFATNALNPKATLFFIAAFAVLVSPHTPRLIRAGYGAWISLTTMAWFTFVALVFDHERIRGPFLRHRHWIDRALGAIFIAFSLSLLFATLR
jgi:RhtB (resistance to homoserine/threonine) family protein